MKRIFTLFLIGCALAGSSISSVEIKYLYHPETHVLSGALTLDKDNVVVLRRFYFFDEASLSLTILEDDGSKEDPNDLEGVSFQKTKTLGMEDINPDDPEIDSAYEELFKTLSASLPESKPHPKTVETEDALKENMDHDPLNDKGRVSEPSTLSFWDSGSLFWNLFPVNRQHWVHYVFGEPWLILTGQFMEESTAGILGQGEISDKIRVSYINGILNISDYCLHSVELLSHLHGNVNIHYVYRATEGWTRDCVKCCWVKLGYTSYEAYLLAAVWKKLIAEMGGIEGGGTIIHYAHSIGGADTFAAKSLMTPEEQKMIKVYTFGSATLIKKEGFQDTMNFVSKRDGVPLVGNGIFYFYSYLFDQDHVDFIGSHYGVPLIDHFFNSEAYLDILIQLGNKFKEEYGIINQST